jgi:UDP-GlcNAc:undecaprenyl-phosphate GlcNAc-1-phosphate transferase
LLDDLIGLKPWQKLIGQFAAGLWVYYAGVRVTGIVYHQAEPWWTLPLTLGWLIVCTNAFNLIDGLDGLAAGIGLLTTLTIILASVLNHNTALALLTVPLAGALLGFLCYNFNPASIFLGDCGSLLIGFLLGCYSVIWSQKSVTILGMSAPLMALAVPMLDVGLSICRRFLRRQPIFTGDHGHIHHRLLARGLTPRAVALVLYGACGIAAAFSLTLSTAWYGAGGLAVVLFAVLLGIGIVHLRYVEFDVFRLMIAGGEFRRILSAQITLKAFDQALGDAVTVGECWQIIHQAAKDFGFTYVGMNLAGCSFEQELAPRSFSDSWEVRIQLSPNEEVLLRRESRSSKLPMLATPFMEVLQSRLRRKRLEMEIGLQRSLPASGRRAHSATGTI